MRSLSLLFAFTLSIVGYASIAQRVGAFGAAAAGRGYTGVTFINEWSAHNNQANMAFAEQSSLGVNYQSLYFVPGLGLSTLSGILKLKSGALGLAVSQFGTDNYNENEFGISYAQRFGERLSMGLQLGYTQIAFGEGYESVGNFNTEFGITGKITESLLFSTHLYNPFQASIGADGSQKIPTILRSGLQYDFSQKASIALEAEKQINQPLRAKMGFELAAAEHISLVAGVLSAPLETTFGVGYQLAGFRIDVSSAFHSVLGFSPQAGLIYRL